jgi:hypothetical protein
MKQLPYLSIFTAVISLLLMGTITASGAIDLRGIQQEPQGVNESVLSRISYQGYLADKEGQPLTGVFNLKFQVWNALSGGVQYGVDVLRNNVQVEKGLFTVLVDVPQEAIDGRRLWLQVYVNNTALTPRQELLATPYAISLKPGAKITSPDVDTLHVGNQSSGWAVEAWSTGNIALLGTSGNVPFGPPSGLYGVYGVGEKGGVYGKSATGTGVFGNSENGMGVVGESVTRAGVYGESNSGYGVRGYSSELAGLFGESESYHGVYGTTERSGPAPWSGVYGFSVGGTGVTGMSSTYNGVKAISQSNEHAALSAWNQGAGPALHAHISDGTVSAIFDGNVQVRSLETNATVVELGEGLDYAEGFDISGEAEVLPGMILVIDPANPGMLTLSSSAYDRKVAGVAAGANGLDSAIKVGTDNYDMQVALAGRVYCYVDATHGAVAPGDLLTTSATPGYAMAVEDPSLAQGSILGKAMQGLEQGQKGLILILVTLQ